jgi:oligopeptide transport system substrate-binding protein
MRTFLPIFSTLLTSFFAQSCIFSREDSKDLHPNQLSGAVRIQFSGEPQSLDPTLTEDGITLRLLAPLMSGLYRYDGNGALLPALAQSHSCNPSFTECRVDVRSDLKWSDGKPLQPQDFLTALERATDPAQGSRIVGMLSTVRGVSERLRPRSKEASIPPLGVRVDGTSLVFQFTIPQPEFRHLLTLPVTYPLREDALRDRGHWDYLRDITLPTIGSYRVVDRRRDQWLTYQKNTLAPKGAPEYLVFRMIADEVTGARLFEKGEIDILSRVSDYEVKRYAQAGLLQVNPLPAVIFLGFRLDHPVFSRVENRRAVSAAISRMELQRLVSVKKGGWEGDRATLGWIPPGIEGSFQLNELEGRGWKAELEKFLKVGALGKDSISLRFEQSARNTLLMEKIQADLKTHLKAAVSLDSSDWKTLMRDLRGDLPPLFRFGWIAAYRDPTAMLTPFRSEDSYNFLKLKDPKLDGWILQIQGMSPSAERRNLLERIQRYLVVEQAYVVPLLHSSVIHVVSKNIGGFSVLPTGAIAVDELRKLPQSHP